MSCGCANRKKQEDYSWVREMAKKTAILTDTPQVIYRDNVNKCFKFAEYGTIEADIVEIVSNI